VLKNVPVSKNGTVKVGRDGALYLSVVHQALYLGDKHPGSLVNPNQLRHNGVAVHQLRHNGVAVHECPHQFDETSCHAIFVPESNVTISLESDGVKSHFVTYKPSDEDLDTLDRVHLTSELDKEYYTKSFSEKEEVARRCAAVAKARLSKHVIEQEQKAVQEVKKVSQEHAQEAFHPMDFNFTSIM
jgi:hypothetical protein